MTATDLVDRLAEHRTIGAAPRKELAWLAAHGALRHLDPGHVLSPRDKQVQGLYVLLSGCVALLADGPRGQHKLMEWRAGDVAGVLPYSRVTTPPGDAVVLEPATVLAVPRDLLPDMIRDCHQVTSTLVHAMLDRARLFTSSGLQDEKMVSLGKLSAGLAHELNNPVSAIERAAALLGSRMDEAERATRAPGAAWLEGPVRDAVEAVRASCLARNQTGVRSPIQAAAREEALADWLADHGVDAAVGESLAETAVTVEDLDRLAAAVDGPLLEAVLRWTAAVCSARGLAAEIQEAAMRISGLVLAIKGFTHMDQARVAGPVDLAQGLGNTIAVLRSKARGKSAEVRVDVEPDLPPVHGFAGELNQVWANLLDNAIDAVPPSGRIEVIAGREDRGVLVRIVDDGPGIPPEIRTRIFDPFFTTKPVGQGAGLGLDIARRLVKHNRGEITVESRPGRTEFRVLLPAFEPGVSGRAS